MDKIGFLGVSNNRESACNAGDIRSLVLEDPLENEKSLHSIFLPESLGVQGDQTSQT